MVNVKLFSAEGAFCNFANSKFFAIMDTTTLISAQTAVPGFPVSGENAESVVDALGSKLLHVLIHLRC